MRRILLIAVSGVLANLNAQSPILKNAGYNPPAPIRVAPGQVITLYITGTKTILPSQSPSLRATTTPLPVTLGGFSVAVQLGNDTIPAPLFSVVQTSNCTGVGSSSPDCITTALTVQIPYEITPRNPVEASPAELPADVIVTDKGTQSGAFPISPIMDNIHVITSCDSQTLTEFFEPPCSGVAAHADGTMVSAGSPAKAGEAVVIYAFGLGQTTPVMKTGVTTPTPAPALTGTVIVQFDFRPSAVPTRPYYANSHWFTPVAAVPLFAGLTPGQVGLYQINVRLPNPLPAVQACQGSAQSNLTIDIGGLTSFDGAAICVRP